MNKRHKYSRKPKGQRLVRALKEELSTPDRLRSAPKYTSLLTAGGTYTALHYDYTFLASLVLVVAKDGGKKLFLMWPPNENNMRLMKRRARGETPFGWEDCNI
jgi:hypothetical protein